MTMPTTDKSLTITSYAGAATSIIAGLTLTEWGVVVGIVTAIVTMLINAWSKAIEVRLKHQAEQREEERHKAEIERIRAEIKGIKCKAE